MDELAKYKGLYIQTAQQYLKSIKSNLALLEKNPNNEEAIKQVHIDAHSLKSQSLLMQYNNIGFFCEATEKTMYAKLEGDLELTPEILKLIEEGTKTMIASLLEIEKNNKDLDLSQETKKLKKLSRREN